MDISRLFWDGGTDYFLRVGKNTLPIRVHLWSKVESTTVFFREPHVLEKMKTPAMLKSFFGHKLEDTWESFFFSNHLCGSHRLHTSTAVQDRTSSSNPQSALALPCSNPGGWYAYLRLVAPPHIACPLEGAPAPPRPRCLDLHAKIRCPSAARSARPDAPSPVALLFIDLVPADGLLSPPRTPQDILARGIWNFFNVFSSEIPSPPQDAAGLGSSSSMHDCSLGGRMMTGCRRGTGESVVGEKGAYGVVCLSRPARGEAAYFLYWEEERRIGRWERCGSVWPRTVI
jgi:hypothetical protein